ncbi:galactose-3-O-sulfotransferase 3 [Phycodurus eques]|uniref:galactose-3-O-sulfotransferase 3 n=1 Tax=Phycodurus eques TaxID=693459 RepID=UPI002ACD6ED2|nr:galactose-3-O-sulfotransferase 3 [Phycodurus eques]XP_061524982.1 galactose-3-O-sulfotransferase 3 [Phycodurus eques]
MRMSQKKILLAFSAVTTVTLLMRCGGRWSRTADRLRSDCPALRPHPAAGPKAKHTNVAFLKTHKTASSTVQNLLFRFAERNNLTVALPTQACGHQFCYPRPFDGHFVHPHTLPPNVIGNHMRYDAAELRRLMPNDTRYVTILREPAAMFESLFSYYNQHCKTFKRVPKGSLDAFLERPWRYYRPEDQGSMYARNTLTFDLGGDKDHPATDAAYARSFAAEVERVFSLVMIAEHFDESLVLLRHILSWDLDDVVYVKLNVRAPASKRRLTPGLAGKIRTWNWIDAHLYDHFNASLWRRLAALGSACVDREVRLLRVAKERLLHGCFGGRRPLLRLAGQIQNKDLRPWQPSAKVGIMGYDLPANLSSGFSSSARELCLKLVVAEVQYTRILLRSQSIRYHRPRLSLHSRPVPDAPTGPTTASGLRSLYDRAS